MILDSQVYTALCIALVAAVLAIQLGTSLYTDKQPFVREIDIKPNGIK